MNKTILVTQIDEVQCEIGDPDCKLIEPFEVDSNSNMKPWMLEYTSQNIFMIHSDKILTISEPSPKLLKIYEDCTKE